MTENAVKPWLEHARRSRSDATILPRWPGDVIKGVDPFSISRGMHPLHPLCNCSCPQMNAHCIQTQKFDDVTIVPLTNSSVCICQCKHIHLLTFEQSLPTLTTFKCQGSRIHPHYPPAIHMGTTIFFLTQQCPEVPPQGLGTCTRLGLPPRFPLTTHLPLRDRHYDWSG